MPGAAAADGTGAAAKPETIELLSSDSEEPSSSEESEESDAEYMCSSESDEESDDDQVRVACSRPSERLI